MFYVGWSDSVLSPSEMKFIREVIDEMTFLSEADKQYLRKWTDPKNPPPDDVFKSWIAALQQKSAQLDSHDRQNLVDLGVQISTSGHDQGPPSKETFSALAKLEKTLGIDNPVSAQLLFKQLSPSDVQTNYSSSFSIEKMKILLDGEYKEVKDRMRALLRDPIFELRHESDKDLYRLRVLEQVKSLAKQGVSAYSFPKIYGGGERNGDHMAVFEMLALNDLSLTVKFGVQFGLFGGALYLLGTEKHHRKYLEAMHKAELLGCFAMTETGHGSNVKGLETKAVYDHDSRELIIDSPNPSAGKEYIGNALHSSMSAVFAQLIVDGVNHGVHAILVPLRNQKNDVLPGITIEDCGYKLGLNGVDNGRIWFDNVRVPVTNLLNRYGDISENGEYQSPIASDAKRFFTMLGALVLGRISVGLASVSATKKALTIATKYALKRRQFGPDDQSPETVIMDYPSHMERLIPPLVTTYAYDFALHELAQKQVDDDGTETRKIETLAAGLKAKASWHSTKTIQECREACGGKGYLVENQFSTLKADSDIFTTFEGDNTVLLQLVAKGILTEFKESFHNDGSMAVVKFLLRKANYKIAEYDLIKKRNTDYGHLTSFEFLKESFDYRYEKTLIKLSERMRKYLRRKIGQYQAFLKTQVHMIDLAHAFIDRVTLSSFHKKIVDSPDELKPILSRMYQLYALDNIYQNRGWFLENDYMEGSKTKAIRKVRTKLIQELRPDVEALVDSFDIPNELVKAPIALKEFS